jgi:hypothetical protein
MKTGGFILSTDRNSMKLRLTLLITCLLMSLLALGQPSDSAPQLLFELENVRLLTADKLQQLYTVDSENKLTKYGPDGEILFSFTNNLQGTIDYLDATNPFQLLVYFREFNFILVLDRTLNEMARIQLADAGVYQSTAVAFASDGNMWVFDQLSGSLKKIDRQGKVLLDSGNLSWQVNADVLPGFILEREQQVFLHEPAIGVLVLDIFGQYQKTIPIKNASRFQVRREQLLYLKEHQIQVFHLRSLLEKPLVLPHSEEPVEDFRIGEKRLYLQRKNKVEVWSLGVD